MSSSHHRPVYIPKNRRRGKTSNDNGNNSPSSDHPSTSAAGRKRPPPQQQQQPRFHGAFTGGFSAGHFNTVATKEGWMPSTAKKTDQKLEDFMDEEDHAEWGGPTKIREDFAGLAEDRRSSQTNNQAAQSPKPINSKSSLLQPSSVPVLSGLESALEIKHETVGPRLLRRLGWREGGTAFVPDETPESHLATTTNGDHYDDDDDDENTLSRIHLSKNRVRRLQLQTNRTKVPPPKLDQCGLGFEPYQDAPEFQRYRERRKQQAQDRATYNQRDNVYRISDVAGGEEDDDGNNSNGKALSRSEDNSNDQHGRNEYLSYETAEDFVGKRSSAGFALRDDEDDAYDNQQSHGGDRTQKVTSKTLGDDYNMEVYEHESSDEDGALSSNKIIYVAKLQSSSVKPSSTNLFAAWAGGGEKKSNTKQSNPSKAAPQPAMTSSGQPPVPGFTLGTSLEGNRKRYPGPDIPRDFDVQRHEFGENEHPEVFQTISRAMKLQQEEEAATAAIQNQRRFLLQRRQSEPMSSNFASLADSMKRRFTSSTPSSLTATSTQEQGQQHPAGLYLPDPIKRSKDQDAAGSTLPTPKPSVSVTRTVHSFFPVPLVCKRFRVSAPSHFSTSGGTVVSADARQTEATYFEQEILSSANARAKGNKKEDSIDSIVKDTLVKDGEDNEQTEIPKKIDRPSLQKLKSIFEASSDVSVSDDEVEEEEGQKVELFDKIEHILGKEGDATAFGLEAPAESIDTTVTETNHNNHALVEYQSRTVATTERNSNSETSEDESTQSSHRRRKKSRKKEKKKKRKRSRRSRSPIGSDGDGRRRKTKKEKKGRK